MIILITSDHCSVCRLGIQSSSVPSASTLNRGQLLRLRMRAWNRRAWAVWLLILLLGEARGLASALTYHSWVPAAIPPVVVVVLIVPIAAITTAREYRLLRLEAVSPEAVRAIRDGLAGAGLPVPDDFVLASRGATGVRFHAFPRRRTRLYIGLPQLLALPGSTLHILAAYAMAVGQVTAYPAAAGRLWSKRTTLETRRAALERRGKGSTRQARRIDGFLAATESFAQDVRSRSDQAAAIAAGSADAAARALCGELAANIDFYEYAARFRPLIVRKRRAPASLYAAWYATWTTAPEWAKPPARYSDTDFQTNHPALPALDAASHAAYINGLRDGREGLPASSMLSPDITRHHVKEVAKSFNPAANNIRLVDGDKIDISYLYDDDPGDEPVITAATTILGRPADRLDAVQLLRDGRGPELAAQLLGPDNIDPDDPDGGLNRGMVYALLLTGAVKTRGMLQLDPYDEWLFTTPDGDRLDLAEIVTQAVHGAIDHLRPLLHA